MQGVRHHSSNDNDTQKAAYPYHKSMTHLLRLPHPSDHHIDENKTILLSDPDIARANPFEYQKKDRLVYCNLIEHLLLHLKIVNECHKTNPVLGGGGVEAIRRQINGYYEDKPCSQSYHTDLYNVIAEKYDDYIKVLKYGIRLYEDIGYFDSLQNFASNWEYQVVDFILKDLQK
jgi:hypothetical protein